MPSFNPEKTMSGNKTFRVFHYLWQAIKMSLLVAVVLWLLVSPTVRSYAIALINRASNGAQQLTDSLGRMIGRR